MKVNEKRVDYHLSLYRFDDDKIKKNFIKRANVQSIKIYSDVIHYFDELNNIVNLYIDQSHYEKYGMYVDKRYKNVSTIKTLCVSNSVVDMEELSNFQYITHLTLCNNESVMGCDNLVSFRYLETLTLQYLSLNKYMLDAISRCEGLRNLEMYKCDHTKDVNYLVRLPKGLKNLRCFTSHHNFYFDIPISIESFTNEGNYIEDTSKIEYDLKDHVNLKERK